jgi:hypothetical protein
MYWVVSGWFISVAVASAVLLSMEGVGLLGRGEVLDAIWISVGVALGFATGGFFAGFRTAAAPILHGAAMAATSFVAWLLSNIVLGGVTTGVSAWEPLTVRASALALLVQGGAAILGCWLGYRAAPVRVK